MTNNSNPILAIAEQYFAALRSGDLGKLDQIFADDVIWHQPGNGSLSGTHRGKPAVFRLFGKFMEKSGGSFAISEVKSMMGNGNMVAAALRFSASKPGANIAMDGIDVMQIADGKIREVWLFSGDQAAEDRFWG